MTADDVALAARLVVAMILVVSGIGKVVAVLRHVPRHVPRQFGGYAWITLSVGLALPLYELVLAALLLVRRRRVAELARGRRRSRCSRWSWCGGS